MTAVGLALYESLVCYSSGFCVASVLVVSSHAASLFPSASTSYATETAGVKSGDIKKTTLLVHQIFLFLYVCICVHCESNLTVCCVYVYNVFLLLDILCVCVCIR